MRHDSKRQIHIVTRVIFATLFMFAYLVFAGEFALAQEPVTVKNADGSTTVTHPDGSITVKHTDGSTTVTQPDGSSATTDIPDTRYGSGGTMDEEKDAKQRVIRRAWKDPRRRVKQSEYTNYSEEGVEVIDKTYRRTPEGEVTGSTETTTRSDPDGNEIYRETKIFDEKDNQTGGTKTEVEPDGSKTKYRWDPKLGIYVLQLSGTPGTQPDLGTSVTKPAGNQTVNHRDGSISVNHPDGSITTTGIPDDKHGSGGTRDEEMDPQGRVRQKIWRDRTTRGLEWEDTHYGPGNEKEVSTKTYNPSPSGGVRRSKETITRTDREGKEIYTETRIFDPKNGAQTSGSKTEVDRTGRKRNYRWDPREQGYVEVVASVIPQTSRPAKSSAARGFAVVNEITGGLNTTTFTTPRGKVRVNLPDDMAAGDTLSGTVIAEPQGKDEKERAASQGELSGYVVELEKHEASSTSRILKSAIPTASSTTYLILRDKDRKEVAKIEVPLAQQPPPVEKFDLPTVGQQGRAIEVTGRFDGDSSTTNLKVGGEDLEVLAESPRKVVARNSDQKTGPTELAVEERGQIVKGEFHSLGIKLSAPKLNLLRGEQTTLTVTVHGLEGIREDVPLVLENKSVDVITMGEQNVERIIISPAQAQAGSYTINRQLTGIQPGAFTITGTVTARNRDSNQPLSSTAMIGDAQKAAGTPGYTICGAGCQLPATEQGSGRVRCISTSACKGRGTGCACHMFRRPINTNKDFEHVENPDVYEDREAGYDYVCRCVKK